MRIWQQPRTFLLLLLLCLYLRIYDFHCWRTIQSKCTIFWINIILLVEENLLYVGKLVMIFFILRGSQHAHPSGSSYYCQLKPASICRRFRYTCPHLVLSDLDSLSCSREYLSYLKRCGQPAFSQNEDYAGYAHITP